MTTILLETSIAAPVPVCFDLARSIDAHRLSTPGTNERAIGGRTSGLIGPGEYVTWQATHFGIRQTMTVTITAMDPPWSFTDVMVKGAFSYMHHRHTFREGTQGTIMTDVFTYKVPFGLIGKMADRLVLRAYMTRLLKKRNAVIAALAMAEKK